MEVAGGESDVSFVVFTYNGYLQIITGGGKKVTRVEVTMDGGETWHLCTLDHHEKPNKYGKYWCWCFWSFEAEVLDLVVAKEIAVRAWDETLNTQPEKLIWNVMVRKSHVPTFLVTFLTPTAWF